jgi:DNA-binding SARP family transcriptional activator
MVAVTLDTVLEQARQLTPEEQVQLLTILEQERQEQERFDRLIKHLDEWMNDTSGYEDEAWPELRAALDRNRAELGMRKLFDE